MRYLVCISLMLVVSEASADLCISARNQKVKSETNQEMDLYRKFFPQQKYWGSQNYDAMILECNRDRDTSGKTLRKVLTGSDFKDMRKVLEERNLPPRFLKFGYKFAGLFRYGMNYAVWKEKGVWHVLIPYSYKIVETVKNRIDLNPHHATLLYERSEIVVTGRGNRESYLKPAGAKNVFIRADAFEEIVRILNHWKAI